MPLSLILVVMLRHAARLHPNTVAMMGGLASAGIAATASALFHELDASVMVLLWTLETTLLIVTLAGVSGRRLFASNLAREIAG